MIWTVPAALALGAVLALWRGRGDRDRVAVAGALCAVVAVGNLLWLVDALDWLPVVDLAVAGLALRVRIARGAAWAGVVAILAYLRIAMHAGLELTGPGAVVGYIHALNALFAAQVAVLCFPGGVDECRRLFHRVRRRDLFRAVQPACRAEGAR